MKSRVRSLLLLFFLSVSAPGGVAATVESSGEAVTAGGGVQGADTPAAKSREAWDISDWLLSKRGFFLLPVIITEPALDYGGGGALLYFHGGDERLAKGISPDISGAEFAMTGNNSWAGGVFHLGYWLDDRLRYTGVLAHVDGNLNMYNSLLGMPFSFNMAARAYGLIQEAVFRLGDTPFFLGPRLKLLLADSSFTEEAVDASYKMRTDYFNPGLTLTWDTRNTSFTPSSGRRGDLMFVYGQPLGNGDDPFSSIELNDIEYFPLGGWAVLGVRARTAGIWGYTPEYVRPGVQMRGVPMASYQGNFVFQIELENRIHITDRWDILLLGGTGTAVNESLLLSREYNMKVVGMGGAGFRYLCADKLGLSLGMDFAMSNDDWTLSIVMGNAWR